MKRSYTGCIGLVLLALSSSAFGREWTDTTGKFRIEAELVTVKAGKAYLEKSDGTVVPVPLDRLSKKDVEHIQSLPEYREYFAKNPVAGASQAAEPVSPTGASRMVVLSGVEESMVGEVRRFSGMGWSVNSLAFSPNGGLLAVGKMDQALMVFDVDRTTRTAFYDKLEGLGQVQCVAFTPDGKWLLSGGYTGRIQLWEVGLGGTLTEGRRFVGHAGEIKTICISSDSKTVLSGGGEKILRCWDLETCRENFAIDGFQGDVRATFIVANGKRALACDGASLVLVDMEKGVALKTMKLASPVTQAAAIAPDGSLVVVSDSYALRIWDVQNGREYPPLQDREIQWSCAFLPNGKYLVSGGRGKVNLWKLDTQQKVHEFDTAGTSYVQTLACSPDNRHIAAIPGSAGQDLQVFRVPAEVAQ